jgi:hypothetical protein
MIIVNLDERRHRNDVLWLQGVDTDPNVLHEYRCRRIGGDS